MTPPSLHTPRPRGSVLIIVLWIAFGLVALTLYFAHAMSLELRAADHRAAAIEAEQAILGAARYVTNLLARVESPGAVPDPTTYRAQAVPVAHATFWLLGRADPDNNPNPQQPQFGLVDEASKLNLNTVTAAMLEALPGMSQELAAAIVDWRDADQDLSQGGAESETYLRLNPPYLCKNTNFESVAELRLVVGAELDLLFSEDANLNGILDPNENDGNLSAPEDDRNGQLNPGLLDLFTVHTRHPTTGTNVNNPQQLAALLQQFFSTDRANQILQSVQNGAGSVLEFFIRSGMTREEFEPIEGALVGTNTVGLVNVNTASQAVLACIPGIGVDLAPTLVAYRQSNPAQLNTVTWLAEVLERENALLAAPFVTGRSFQFSADIAAVGHHGRGYRRVQVIVDTAEGLPTIRYRRDLTHLGWALGSQTRQSLLLANSQP